MSEVTADRRAMYISSAGGTLRTCRTCATSSVATAYGSHGSISITAPSCRALGQAVRFFAGDVRHGSIKRVASAVGEGAVAVQQVHRFLAEK